MDFKRIEWIFFLAFLGLNMFLFGIYQEGLKEENNVSFSDQTDSIEKRLGKDGITYKGTLSGDKMEGYYLSGEQTNFYDAIQKERETRDRNFFKNGIEMIDNSLTVYPQMNYAQTSYFIDEKNTRKSLEAFLNDKDSVLFGNEYHYLSNFSSLEGEFPEAIVSQSYKNIPFKDDTAQISLKLEKSDEADGIHKIYKYTQTHIQGIEELRDKMDLFSERDAIETLYINNKIPSNSKINFIELAYTRIYKIREKNVYVPVWFVGIKSSESNLQIEQVNAMSNTIITNNTVPKVENHS
ncbi:two-component system regulatory protein YycI [Candidatus Enterococcus ikei]|uniref:Two-component system regulatory protein YycI n=1 Tax=Candidatus Enterococcus ikei TaxID=2815326 RepID=A0ABS3GXW0_9ENTE|nr:two-component system regulatory protein YycI [Enterococcus sp. DIV0869a]MBO0440096.1 two-component system regulatory protein YycI [Enterococcus sp. DIV0869a]